MQTFFFHRKIENRLALGEIFQNKASPKLKQSLAQSLLAKDCIPRIDQVRTFPNRTLKRNKKFKTGGNRNIKMSILMRLITTKNST
jgi:hypothetical protein